MTEQPQEEIIINKLMKETVRRQDQVIIGIMKEKGITDIDMNKVTRHIHKDGTEVWSYDGKTFMKMKPFEFSQIITPQGIKLTATQMIQAIG